MSSIFEGFLSSYEGLQAFGDRSFVQAMLQFEASLARAQAAVGLIPESSAQSIIGTCKVDLFDTAKVVRESARAGSLAIPLVKSLKETVGLFNPAAVAHVHFGCTSQDAIDTAMALVTRDALDLIEADVSKAVSALLELGTLHAHTPMLARTLMQPASVTSFGFKCVAWVAPLQRSLRRLHVARPNALKLQLGGTVGTLSAMNGKGTRVSELMAADLKLTAPQMSWHTQRDEWVALGCELGLLTGSLGKIARDVVLMSQAEVGEVAEPVEPGRGGPSNMPHKHNPVASMVAIAASQRVPQRVAALLAVMPQEHERALGAWQAELAEWPQLVISAHGSARALAQALPGLQVDAQRMLENIDAVRASVSKMVADEWFQPGLAKHAGELALAQLQLMCEPI
ncbi:MAG: 3-carboxy-cis,cis-muconate cycloisomerase [Pseudomonadota bacterium]|jgi:3-carboxy-cis,cis-muconate cycloisomerase